MEEDSLKKYVNSLGIDGRKRQAWERSIHRLR